MSLPSRSPSASSECRTRAAGTRAPRAAMFWVQRDEETCRKRCIDIREVLAANMPATKKFGTIFTLMDQYTDEDSDVNLLMGVQIPTHGPVFIPPKKAVDEDPEARLAAQVCEPSSSSMEPKPSDQPPTSSSAATASSAGETRGATALSPDKAALIEKNKKAALERKSQMQAEVRRREELTIFENMQWIP